MIDEEYSTIVENRGKHCKETRSHHEELRDEGRLNIDTLRLLFPSMLRTLFRSSNQFSSDTGIVEFKSLSAKQWGKKMLSTIDSPLRCLIAYTYFFLSK